MKSNEIIYKERVKRNWSQADLANKLGVTQGMIAFYEQGTRNPTDKNKIKIAQLFNMRVEDIFFNNIDYKS